MKPHMHFIIIPFTLCLLAQLDSHKQQMTYMHELNAQYLQQKCMNDSRGVSECSYCGRPSMALHPSC